MAKRPTRLRFTEDDLSSDAVKKAAGKAEKAAAKAEKAVDKITPKKHRKLRQEADVSAIREGFEQLKPSTEYDALYEAALCRERADWLVGINATRLFSTLYGQTLNVGRVMTPTLAMVVMREAAISAFRPEPFYTVELAFQDFTASGERMKQKVLADDVARKCVGSVLNVTKAENKEKSEKPPALYDLTSLQRDANRVLGFTAQQTLD